MSTLSTSNQWRCVLFSLLAGSVALAGAHAEGTKPLVLPKASETIPGQRIGWNFDNVAELLTKANADEKPIVAVMITKRCGWCRIYLAHVLRCSDLNAFAGQAHFAILYAPESEPERDSQVGRDNKQFMDLLKVEGYPVTAVVSVKNKSFSQVGQVAGVAPEGRIIRFLTAAGLKAGASSPQPRQAAAIGLPVPAACGANAPTDALAASAPVDVQRGIAP